MLRILNLQTGFKFLTHKLPNLVRLLLVLKFNLVESCCRDEHRTHFPYQPIKFRLLFSLSEFEIVRVKAQPGSPGIVMESRKAAPALRARPLRSYVPLRRVPSESVLSGTIPGFPGGSYYPHKFKSVSLCFSPHMSYAGYDVPSRFQALPDTLHTVSLSKDFHGIFSVSWRRRYHTEPLPGEPSHLQSFSHPRVPAAGRLR